MIGLPLKVLAFSLAATGAASAQEKLFRSLDVPTGKQARLGIYENVGKDCVAGPNPEVNVTTLPKNGTVAVRTGKTKAGALPRCPKLEVPAQGVFYQPSKGFTGADEVTYEVKRPDGRNQVITIKITVKNDAKPADKPSGGIEL
ncbi:MAG TPA: 4-aminobutyrate aminotransferase [Beijerinckiaceae bacterium]|jgi:hypothetical protein